MIGTYAELFGYFDYGLTRRSEDQQDQSISTDALWNLKDKEKYYDFGAGTNIYLVPKKLTLRLQYDYSKSDGNTDLTLSSDALNNPNGNALFGTGANNEATPRDESRGFSPLALPVPTLGRTRKCQTTLRCED